MIKETIDPFHFEDIKNQHHPSAFFKHDLYDMIILRLPFMNSEKEIDYTSRAFIATNESYYYYDKSEHSFHNLGDIQGFYRLLDSAVDATMKMVNDYTHNIEEMEDGIYEGRLSNKFNQEWLRNKNDLIRINRVLIKTSEVFGSIMRAYKKEDDFLEHHFEDINEHIQRALRNSEHLLAKLDSIYNFNLTQTNEEMNRIIYTLTLLSAIFLPLNLVVGFFGMNTTSLPFTQTDGGTYNVILLLIISALSATLLTLLIKKRF
jgi:magnesium transporter